LIGVEASGEYLDVSRMVTLSACAAEARVAVLMTQTDSFGLGADDDSSEAFLFGGGRCARGAGQAGKMPFVVKGPF
jgi:hypothetical protein